MKRYDISEIANDYLRGRDNGKYVDAEVAEAMYKALIETRAIVCDGCEEGFNPLTGDWAEMLFKNNATITEALELADKMELS